jgi:hypothetical protein
MAPNGMHGLAFHGLFLEDALSALAGWARVAPRHA